MTMITYTKTAYVDLLDNKRLFSAVRECIRNVAEGENNILTTTEDVAAYLEEEDDVDNIEIMHGILEDVRKHGASDIVFYV